MTRDRATRISDLNYPYQEQDKRRITACNLCGDRVLATIAVKDRYGYDASASMCMGCGLVFLNPVMTGEAYADFYARVYRPLVSAFHGRLIDASSIQEEQQSYAEERCNFLAPYVAGIDGRMLDIGGSTGVVAAEVKRRFGLDAVVLDPSPAELAEAARRGLATISGFVEDLNSAAEKFQFITLFQTVDHLIDIKGTLQKCNQLLDENGWLYVDIVDFEFAYRRAGAVEGAVKIDHPYYLTQATMEAFLRISGYAIESLHIAQDHLHVGYLCQRAKPQSLGLSSVDAHQALQRIRHLQGERARKD